MADQNDNYTNQTTEEGRKGGTAAAPAVRVYDQTARTSEVSPLARFIPIIVGLIILGSLIALATRFMGNRNDTSNRNDTMSQSESMRQNAPSNMGGSSGTMGAPGPRGGMESGSSTGAGTMPSPPGPATVR